MDDEGSRLLRTTHSLRLTRRGWVTLVIGVAAFISAFPLGRRELLVLAGAALVASLGGLAIARWRRPHFEIIRLFAPPVVSAGRTVRVTMRIRNAGSTPSPALLWNDAVPWREPREPQELAPVPALSTRLRTVSVGYDAHPPRRGIFPIGPLVVEHEDPFGMARSVIAVGTSDKVIVVPAVSTRPAGGPILADGEGSAQLVQRRVTGNDDDLSTREYRPGDALRRVHWRASARHSQLMVRQEEHRSYPDARIVVDTRAGGYPDADLDRDVWPRSLHSESFEWVVKMLASLGVHLDDAGFRLTISESGIGQVEQMGERWEGGRRSESFLTSLAGVRLLENQPDVPVGMGAQDHTGPVFALLSDPEETTLDWIIRQRKVGQAAIAFLVAPRQSAIERLADAGWLCVPVHPLAEPGDAWLAAAMESGYARGAR
jgi:hypothetical protein